MDPARLAAGPGGRQNQPAAGRHAGGAIGGAAPRANERDAEAGGVSSSGDHAYVSRGGAKLAAGLDAFGVKPAGQACADLGSNVGGFVDCLLQRGAARVYAIDTGYGTLAYRLRTDPRVVVMERVNAMHVALPEPVDLVTIDVAWTRQGKILPNAMTLLKPGGRIITLIKPHYEADRSELRRGVLDAQAAPRILDAVRARIETLGLTINSVIKSPIPGGAGNVEFLALLRMHRSSPRCAGDPSPGR
jgi:23S rRNA (cytidine1920-2'-O)/16S rRNA (cytidine1409-2'-O)-methyltransferase